MLGGGDSTMRIFALAGALAATTFVAGCGETTGLPTPTTTEPLSLERTKWSLVKSRLEAPPPEKQDIVELQFTGDRVAAHSGCNRGAGGYRIESGALIVTQMASTRRACIGAAGAYEPVFFAFLAASPAVRLEPGGELVLEASGGETARSLRFRPVPMPSAQAVQKFIYVASERVPCTGVAPMQCLQIRSSPDEPWQLYYGEIVGFEFEPGIEYRLRIYEDDVPDPPADGSSKRRYLDMIVEQKVVTPPAT
jgi:heat shock protein HslJ